MRGCIVNKCYTALANNLLHEIAPQAEVILYGAQAKGDAEIDSDVDLLILVDKDKLTSQDVVAITYPLYDLELLENVMVSPLVYTKKQWEERPFRTPYLCECDE